MARVFRRVALTGEHMPEMAATVGADDLGSPSIGVGNSLHGALNLIVEAGPATERLEFSFGAAQGCVATFAGVESVCIMLVIRAGKGSLCALVYDDAFFFGGKCVVCHVAMGLFGSDRSDGETRCSIVRLLSF